MSTFDIILVVYGAVLALTALTVVYRMVVGPTILDRAVSTDSLVVLVVLAMALYTASAKASWAGPAMLGLTGLAFIGTVTFARFVGREEPRTPQLRRHRQEAGTSTGPLDAIHLDHRGEEHVSTRTAPVGAVGSDHDTADTADAGAALGIDRPGDDGPGSAGRAAANVSDRFERGFGAEEGSRGFEVEEHGHEGPGPTDVAGSPDQPDVTGPTEETR